MEAALVDLVPASHRRRRYSNVTTASIVQPNVLLFLKITVLLWMSQFHTLHGSSFIIGYRQQQQKRYHYDIGYSTNRRVIVQHQQQKTEHQRLHYAKSSSPPSSFLASKFSSYFSSLFSGSSNDDSYNSYDNGNVGITLNTKMGECNVDTFNDNNDNNDNATNVNRTNTIGFNRIKLTIPIFPLRKKVRLPTEKLVLNLYEPRYLDMVQYIMAMQQSYNSNNDNCTTNTGEATADNENTLQVQQQQPNGTGQQEMSIPMMFGAIYTSNKPQFVPTNMNNNDYSIGPIVPILQPNDTGVLFFVVDDDTTTNISSDNIVEANEEESGRNDNDDSDVDSNQNNNNISNNNGDSNKSNNQHQRNIMQQQQRRRNSSIRIVGQGGPRFRIVKIQSDGTNRDKSDRSNNGNSMLRNTNLPFILADVEMFFDDNINSSIVPQHTESTAIQSSSLDNNNGSTRSDSIDKITASLILQRRRLLQLLALQQRQQKLRHNVFRNFFNFITNNAINGLPLINKDENKNDSNSNKFLSTKSNFNDNNDYDTENDDILEWTSIQRLAGMTNAIYMALHKYPNSSINILLFQCELLSFAIRSFDVPYEDSDKRQKILEVIDIHQRLVDN